MLEWRTTNSLPRLDHDFGTHGLLLFSLSPSHSLTRPNVCFLFHSCYWPPRTPRTLHSFLHCMFGYSHLNFSCNVETCIFVPTPRLFWCWGHMNGTCNMLYWERKFVFNCSAIDAVISISKRVSYVSGWMALSSQSSAHCLSNVKRCLCVCTQHVQSMPKHFSLKTTSPIPIADSPSSSYIWFLLAVIFLLFVPQGLAPIPGTWRKKKSSKFLSEWKKKASRRLCCAHRRITVGDFILLSFVVVVVVVFFNLKSTNKHSVDGWISRQG